MQSKGKTLELRRKQNDIEQNTNSRKHHETVKILNSPSELTEKA